MYYDDISIKDVYKAIDGISDDVVTICENQNTIINKINDVDSSIDSFNNDISKKIEYLSEVSVCLLNEIKKTNLLLKRISKTNENLNVVSFDVKKHSNRSLIVINDSFLVAQEYAKELAKKVNKKLEIINTYKFSEISSVLTNADVNDYVVINYNALFNDGIECLSSALLDNEINITVQAGTNRKTITMSIKPINYIIYSKNLELIDPKLIEGLDIVK